MRTNINCSRCLSDSSIQFLQLDNKGECKYCRIHDEMEKEYKFNKNSFQNLLKIAKKIKTEGKKNRYDCVVGVSGGKDSSYMLYLIKKKLMVGVITQQILPCIIILFMFLKKKVIGFCL